VPPNDTVAIIARPGETEHRLEALLRNNKSDATHKQIDSG